MQNIAEIILDNLGIGALARCKAKEILELVGGDENIKDIKMKYDRIDQESFLMISIKLHKRFGDKKAFSEYLNKREIKGDIYDFGEGKFTLDQGEINTTFY